jgi:hypothetical protein
MAGCYENGNELPVFIHDAEFLHCVRLPLLVRILPPGAAGHNVGLAGLIVGLSAL